IVRITPTKVHGRFRTAPPPTRPPGGRGGPPGPLGATGRIWPAAHAPFGGYKQSGIGRELGVAGFEEYTETKLVATAE
uniref:aldehyde dehydrogenase family protein n=1 Tax=Nocardia wallacei TaxID=480035 RepID=UPI002456BFD3